MTGVTGRWRINRRTCCSPQKRNPLFLKEVFSRCTPFQFVFVVKASEYRSHYNAMILRNAMPLEFSLLDTRVWNSRSEPHMRA